MTNAGVTQAHDPSDPLWLLNEYRAAEIHGAGAIMRMMRLADSASLSTDLSRHMRDEAVHAWLWTKTINDLGGEIVEVDMPYQARLGMHFGMPGTLTELLALTWVSERRGVIQYTEHLDAPNVTPLIQRTLRGILKDEHWHVRYINDELQQRVRADRRVQDLIDRAQAAEAQAIADLVAAESLPEPTSSAP
jgi:1,2-phenylacetyl-CoA epoxidase catalytic subunit